MLAKIPLLVKNDTTCGLSKALEAMLADAAGDAVPDESSSIKRWRRHLLLPGVVVRRGEFAPIAEICRRAHQALDAIQQWADDRKWAEDSSLRTYITSVFFVGMLVPDQLWINAGNMSAVRGYGHSEESRARPWRDLSCLLSFRSRSGKLQLRVVHKELAVVFVGITFHEDRNTQLLRPSAVEWIPQAYSTIDNLKTPDGPSIRRGLVDPISVGPARNQIRLWQQCVIEWLCRSIAVSPSCHRLEAQ